jgi:phospholipase/carboxylesterase
VGITKSHGGRPHVDTGDASTANVTRRHFARMTGGAVAGVALGGCYGLASSYPSDGRLAARPRADVKTSASEERPLRLDPERDAILRMPRKAAAPFPLLVLLHGATGSGERMLRRVGTAPDEAGVAVLAPDSREVTWDAMGGRYGADVQFINRALERVFETVAVDPDRIAVGGFSDGATYALSLGLINGDLFSRVVAFSPGFVVPGVPHGHPEFFVSHGTDDSILPIDRCSRLIVPALQKRGYDVTFREFNGGHEVPSAIAHEGLAWVAQPAKQRR